MQHINTKCVVPFSIESNSVSKRQRQYESSHPWLTFQCNLAHVSSSVWMNLGAVQSKCRHVANTLLPPPLLSELQKIYLAKGVMATTAIEGNSMSEAEVRAIIDGRANVAPLQDYQAQEVSNIVDACNAIVAQIAEGDDGSLSVEQIRDLNRRVLRNLPPREGETPGEIPAFNVVVGRYRGAPRGDCAWLLSKFCDWMNAREWQGTAANRLALGVIRAVLAHLYFAWIYPFGDGNGRTARLLEFKILLAAGAPLPAAHLLSSHYNQTRAEYYRQLDAASRSGGRIFPFLEYAIQGLVDGLDRQIEYINSHQWRATWKEYVFAEFGPDVSAVARRQRQVALDLWDCGPDGVPASKIQTLTPEIAVHYARRDAQAVARDLKVLEKMGLIERHHQVIAVKFHTLLEQRKPWAATE